MALRPSEVRQIALDLNRHLTGAFLQKAFVPDDEHGFLEFRLPGQSVLIGISLTPQTARVSTVFARPPSPPTSLAFQGKLRRDMMGAQVTGIRQSAPRQLIFSWKSKEASGFLCVELSAPGFIALLDSRAAVTAVTPPSRKVEIENKKILPETVFECAEEDSRLVGKTELPFSFAQAAETLLGTQEATGELERRRRHAMAPLKAKIARLERTLKKVRQEAHREENAFEHRKLGELLSQNMGEWTRGEKLLRVVEYTESGPLERDVTLHPHLSPQEEVELHFRQYRRLLRGSVHAQRRFRELSEELAQCQVSLRALEQASPDMIIETAPRHLERTKGAPRAKAFHEFVSSQGQRIWVGKNARANDELTFRLAGPNDVWFHVRGLAGSHVVVPLEKKQNLPSEVMLDAATLAAHFSEAKGETRAEVSYTQVKYVRKVKGGNAGQVTYTHEKTLSIRLDADRLVRLLNSKAEK